MLARSMVFLAFIALTACESSSPAPAERVDSRPLAAMGTTSSLVGTVETNIDSSLPDERCNWTATVAAGTDLSIRATLDGVPGPAYGTAHLMTLTAAEVMAQCETGPGFGTDDLVGPQEGAESNEGQCLFGLGVVPAILPATFLSDGSAVMLLFGEPKGGAAILFPSSASVETDVEFNFATADLYE